MYNETILMIIALSQQCKPVAMAEVLLLVLGFGLDWVGSAWIRFHLPMNENHSSWEMRGYRLIAPPLRFANDEKWFRIQNETEMIMHTSWILTGETLQNYFHFSLFLLIIFFLKSIYLYLYQTRREYENVEK